MPLGTPASDMPTDSLSNPTLPHRITPRNREAHHRIDPLLAGPENDETGEHDGRRHHRVGGHVQEGRADVDVPMPAAGEQQCRQAIYEQSRGPQPRSSCGASATAGVMSLSTACAAMAPTATSRNSALIRRRKDRTPS